VWDPDRFIAALDAFAGTWADRDDLDEMYAELNRRSRENLERLWGDRLTSGPKPPARPR
jgi:hypothetical protein